jgi:hypothetical protein
MKFRNLFIFALVAILFSCDDDDSADGDSAMKYFIKFKVNGEWKMIESKTGVFAACEFCACGSVHSDPNGFYASVDVCNEDGNYMKATQIASWDDTDFEFNWPIFPLASFNFEEDNEYYYSGNSPNQGGSILSITSVSEEEGSIVEGRHFTVKGTFHCNVRKVGGPEEDIAITDGSFVVRFSEIPD